MAHARTYSTSEALKGPHSVSLKVLRLSRPTLANSCSVPRPSAANALAIPPAATLPYPTADPETPFVVTPLLQLPEAFGSAYVGETFSCTLCANNELLGDDETKSVSGVRIAAEMQTPSSPNGVPLELSVGAELKEAEPPEVQPNAGVSLAPAESLQKIITFELKEEGSHTLAVTVTYTETQLAAEGKVAAGGRVPQGLISVKTKTSELAGKRGAGKYVLEAQLENLGQGKISLEPVVMNVESPFKSTSLNMPINASEEEPPHLPVLGPKDVMQVAFLLEQQEDADASVQTITPTPGRRMLVRQLFVQWRSPLGGRGSLKIGPLYSKPR
ncbi:hypothetical protein K490DRAFT_58237 [Saccharata proteae CBS 121410]|uniref:DUF974-domain-containing protein n=1 Tax=Saccharata proteae CBS 121410 TaxID=1314787 RepID=A0A9P4HQ94_9PEZI|nr:hypothetical protein K490DRAFT_58237 [Saccharata proteae CBS 121410]